MDLNIDNYTINELFDSLNNDSKNDITTITVNVLQKCLFHKIEKIKIVDSENLPVLKEDLIEFYTKSFFKIVNDKNLINQLRTQERENQERENQNKKTSKNLLQQDEILENQERDNPKRFQTMNEIQEKKEYRDAFGNMSGEVYNKSYANPNSDSINIQTGLQPTLQATHTVQEGSRFVTKHDNHNPVTTFNTNLKAGIVNPLTRTSMKKILNINTRFRNNYHNTESTNFIIDLPYTIKKVVSLKLIDIELPKTVYTISSKLGNNNFRINGTTIVIPNGAYDSNGIKNKLNDIFRENGKNIQCNYNEYNGKIEFEQIRKIDFSLNFDFVDDISICQINTNVSTIDKNQLTLGWMLGFRGNYIKHNSISSRDISNNRYNEELIKRNLCVKNVKYQPQNCKMPNIYCNNSLIKDTNQLNLKYEGKSKYISESTYDLYGNKYFLLSLNDYQNNHGEIIISSFKEESLINSNVIAKLPVQCNKSCDSNYPERLYFGPTNISKLQIILYDEFGRIVDANNADFALSLAVELLYDL